MDSHKINDLHQYKMHLENKIIDYKMIVRLAEAELKYTLEQIEILSNNQLEIDFDEKPSK